MIFVSGIQAISSGTAGTGAFTPGTASFGYLDWTNAPQGIYLVYFKDPSIPAWERSYCYWNGTTLSRATTQFVSSSSGIPISLTSQATAACVESAQHVGAELGEFSFRFASSTPNSTYAGTFISAAMLGTSAGVTPSNTRMDTEFVARQSTSATTANAVAGANLGTTVCAFSSSSALRGGWQFTFTWAYTTLPTGPRVLIGMTNNDFSALAAEPSTSGTNYAVLGKDSTDTNFQLLVNNGSGSGTKTDIGFAPTTNATYRVKIWAQPGSLTIYMLFMRMDNGSIWYGSTATDVPVTGTGMYPQMITALNGTNTGTAVVMKVGLAALYSGW